MPRLHKCRMFRLTPMTNFDFNSARLVRKGEELEHFNPEPIADKHDHGSHQKPTGELTPKLA